MFASFIILFREVFEIVLIICIILAYLSQIHKPTYKKYVWYGTTLGIIASLGIGLLINLGIITVDHAYEEFFEGAAMIIGGVLILTFLFWLLKQKDSFVDVKEKLNHANNTKAINILALTFVAVLREGFEIVLFFFAARIDTDFQSLVGGLFGTALGILIGIGVYKGGMKLPIKLFFQITNVLLALIALYLLIAGAHEIIEILE